VDPHIDYIRASFMGKAC